ncbi:MAG: hypothetical protein ACLQOO_24975 [Terriglobia bacterium]
MKKDHAFCSVEPIHAGQGNPGPGMRLLWCAPLALMLLCSSVRAQEPPNTITFINNSGEDATVKLIGPTHGYISVPNRAQNTVHVAAGRYSIVTRYCDSSNHCSYNKGDAFDVIQTATQYSEITITLNVVPNGNYHTTPATAAEFGGS